MSPGVPDRLLSLSAGTVLGVPAPEVIEAAAGAGFAGLGLRWEQPGVPTPPVPAVRRSIDAAGLVLLDLEVVRLHPGVPVAAFRPLVDVAAELGARFLLVVSHHPEAARTAEELATIAGWCAGTAVTVALEPMRFTSVPTVRAASALVGGTGRTDLVVLVDALHLHRGGEAPADLAACDAPIGYVQLCDAPLQAPGATDDADALAEEARHHRLFPGDGELPLADLLAALPADLPCTVEVQNDEWAAVDAGRRARHAMTTARRVLDRAVDSPARTT